MPSQSTLTTFFLAAGLAAAIVLLATPLVRVLAKTLGAVATPKADRWHRRTIPLLGGLGIWAATLISASVMGGLDREELLAIGAASALMLVGLVDDLKGMRPSTKLTAQIAVACVLVVFGISLNWTGSQPLNALITIFWFVGATNAFNLLDNMDGLCAGIASIAAVALCWSVGMGHHGVFVLGAALAGASAGFLVYNFNPASIFMGDSGSLFLGSTLAVLATLGEGESQRGFASAIAVPVVLLAIPIFDTTFVTVSRKLSARSASLGGRDHTSHRLVALGFSERQAVLLLYAFAVVAGAAAVGFARVPEATVLLVLLVVGLILLGVRLAKVYVYDGRDFSALHERSFTMLLNNFTYKRRVFEIMLDVLLVSVAYYSAWLIRFDEQFPLFYHQFVTSLPLLIACHIASFLVSGVYRGLWHYISINDIGIYLRGIGLGTLSSVLAIVFVFRFEGYSRGVFIINAMSLFLLLVGSRASFRVLGEVARRKGAGTQRTLIYGAGDGGAILLRELRNNPKHDALVIGFVDDDPSRLNSRLLGMPILGGFSSLPAIVEEYRPDVMILSTLSIAPERVAAVRSLCHASGTKLRQFNFNLTDDIVRADRVF